MLPSDLTKFVDDLRDVPESTAEVQAAWDGQINSFETALEAASNLADCDADFLDQFDELRAITRQKTSLHERLDACFKVLDAIKTLSDQKAAFTRARMAELERRGK